MNAILALIADRINRANANGQEDVRLALLELRQAILRDIEMGVV